MKRKLAFLLLLVCPFAMAAEETTFDGLVETKARNFQRVWIDPTIDLSFYTKILPGTTTFDFRAVRRPSRVGPSPNSRNKDGFPIEEKDRQKLAELTDEVFDAEMANSKHWTIADEPGEDVLIARGALLDIMSRVPPPSVGRTDHYLSSVGEATIVIELVDSLSGEVLVRAAERRAAQQPGGNQQMVRSTSAGNWNEVRRLLRTWATRFVDGLDSIHTASDD